MNTGDLKKKLTLILCLFWAIYDEKNNFKVMTKCPERLKFWSPKDRLVGFVHKLH